MCRAKAEPDASLRGVPAAQGGLRPATDARPGYGAKRRAPPRAAMAKNTERAGLGLAKRWRKTGRSSKNCGHNRRGRICALFRRIPRYSESRGRAASVRRWACSAATGYKEVQNVSVLVAIGVNAAGFREVLGIAEGSREDNESWRGFMRYLRERGLERIRLVISDNSLDLLEALGEFYPQAKWQRCAALLPQRAARGPSRKGQRCSLDAQGHSRPGRQGVGLKKGS